MQVGEDVVLQEKVKDARLVLVTPQDVLCQCKARRLGQPPTLPSSCLVMTLVTHMLLVGSKGCSCDSIETFSSQQHLSAWLVTYPRTCYCTDCLHNHGTVVLCHNTC